MPDTLRSRLLLWYAVIVSLVIVTFAATICYLYWRSLVRDIDRDLRVHAGMISQALHAGSSGDFDFDLPARYREPDRVDRSPHIYYAVWDSRGGLIDRSDPDISLPVIRAPGVTARNGRREVIVAAVGNALILAGQDLDETRREVWSLASTVGSVGAGVLLLSCVGGWFLVGRALDPIARISGTASAMAQGDLTARIAVAETESELEQVALALNASFDRLHRAADTQRRFTADASHELRTPLTTLRAGFDWALRQPRTSSEYAETLRMCSRTAVRMTRIVDELLALAQSDAATLMRRDAVALQPIVDDVIHALRPMAEEKGISIDTAIEPAHVVGDATRLGEAIANLVRNAIEYNRDGGHVFVDMRSDKTAVALRVHDTGIGISPVDLPRVFDRFYRADSARTWNTGGAGLGLAIAKNAIENHGGTITFRSELGIGTEVTVQLLVVPPAEMGSRQRLESI